MTLTTVVLVIALVAILLTALTRFVAHRQAPLWLSFLQNFCGAWFVFSGYVKVADPLGTAYKMEQYFAEFSATAAGAGLGFVEPLFAAMSGISPAVAMIMVVLEVVLGVMLITGTRPRFTSWTFLAVMAFFTVLTGFTYLTGYVPTDATFFEFSRWGAYEATNMRVTDCGCFGDFLKLEPYTSFLKDVFLMVPAVLFVLYAGRMHQWFGAGLRRGISWASVAAASLFGVSNFVWDIPDTDFRPFAEGVNVRERKAAEQEAEANIEVLAYGITDKETGAYQELPFDDYLARFKEFPTERFELTQITSEPAVPHTKISEFELEDADGAPVADDLLAEPGYSVMVVAYRLYDDGTEQREVKRQDSLFVDASADDPEAPPRKVFAALQERSEIANVTRWEGKYLDRWRERIVPFADAAAAAGWRVYAATAYTDPARVDDFRHAAQWAHPVYEGDDILLKTIIRANPGVVVLRDGEILRKYHTRHVPGFEELRAELEAGR